MYRGSLAGTILLFSGILYMAHAYGKTSALVEGDGGSLAINLQETTPASSLSSGNTTTQISSTTVHVITNTTSQITANTTTMHTPNTTAHTTNTTMHTPNTTAHTTNTTMHTPNTTAHTTNTTMHTPNTTAHTTNTTMHTPNITTAHTTANATTHSLITTTSVTPTLAPHPSEPKTGNYTVKKDKVTYIRALLGLELELESSATKKGYFNIVPEKTNVSGTWEKTTGNLKLTFEEGFINFIFVKDTYTYYISEIAVTYHLGSSDSWNGHVTNEMLLRTDTGYSVTCKNTPTIKLNNNMSLTMSNVKLQAFDIHDDQFAKEEECYTDRNIKFVPLAVALAIVGLVLIVLLVVLLARRKRSSGYQRL